MSRNVSRPAILLSAAVCLVGAGVASNAQATIINVDDGSSRTTTYLFQGQGALTDSVSSPYWNPANGSHTVTNATASDGTTATGVNFSIGVTPGYPNSIANSSRNPGSLTAPSGLLNAWTQVGAYGTAAQSLSFSITNLPAHVDYTLYVYAVNGGWATGAPNNRIQDVAVTGGTAHNGISSAGGTQATSFVEGVNYLIFTGNTGAGGAVNGTVSSTSAPGSPASVYAEFNGLQIEYIPEPATLGLLAIGGLMMLPRRGKR
ncbi:MAG: PEP-CTERM sorting domain-containing protein [Phycisphaerales bacterium]